MGTLGNQPNFGAYGFTRTQAESFNGTGSATSFTLGHHVKNAIDIEVLVDNVQQSPFDGSYSVSGTTLTFSGAPASGTNNVYVMYRQVGTVIDTQALIPDDSSVTYAKLGNDIPLGNRNLIINGAMQVAQRGTSANQGGATVGYYTADRFQTKWFGSVWAANHTLMEQSTDAPEGFNYSLKHKTLVAQDYSNALGSWVQYQPENQDMRFLQNGSGLKEFTISLWVKSNKTGNVTISCERDYSYSTYVTINSADTWEHKSVTIPATTNNLNIDYANPSSGGFSIKVCLGGNGSWLVSTDNQWNASGSRGVISPQQTNFQAAVNDYLSFTGIQLEAGTKATPFEHRSYGEELAKCQRYFEKDNPYTPTSFGGSLRGFAYHPANGSGNAMSRDGPFTSFSTTKRATPSMTLYSYNGTSGAVSWITGGGTDTNVSTRAGTQGFQTSSSTYRAFHVWFAWTADAEL